MLARLLVDNLFFFSARSPGAAGSDVKPGKHLSLLLAGADDWASKRLKRDTTTV
jgi:hypothetical protein